MGKREKPCGMSVVIRKAKDFCPLNVRIVHLSDMRENLVIDCLKKTVDTEFR